MSGTTTYHYFDVFGRGEVIRMLLVAADVSFNDHRFGFEEWLKLKPSAEFGTCPILDIDGHNLVQTKAIVRYIAMTHNLYPTDPYDVYLVESFIDQVADVKENLIEFSAHNELDKLAAHYEKQAGFWEVIERRFLKNTSGSGWVVGSKMTVADVFLFNALWDWFLSPQRAADHAAKIPERLKQFSAFFLEQNPRIRAYVDARQARPF